MSKSCFRGEDTDLKLTNKEQAYISWKPGPLAANVTRNMIGAAANSYMHVIGSQ